MGCILRAKDAGHQQKMNRGSAADYTVSLPNSEGTLSACSNTHNDFRMTSVRSFKSAVARPSVRKFLSFSFSRKRRPRRRIAPQAIARFRAKVRELTPRQAGRSLAQIVEKLSSYLKGWRGYFGFCQTPSVLRKLDEWIRRRLRAIVWTQWRRGPVRFDELRRRGVGRELALKTAGNPRGHWRLANSAAATMALPNIFFASLGLPSVAARHAA